MKSAMRKYFKGILTTIRVLLQSDAAGMRPLGPTLRAAPPLFLIGRPLRYVTLLSAQGDSADLGRWEVKRSLGDSARS
jgi:hypothetical protein